MALFASFAEVHMALRKILACSLKLFRLIYYHSFVFDLALRLVKSHQEVQNFAFSLVLES